MGGKAKRRREKNYLAAHGGGSARLPPPPEASAIDVLPSKLRKIMSFTSGKESVYGAKKRSINAEKRQASADESGGKMDKIERSNDETAVTEDPDNVYDDVLHKDAQEKKKKKRNRNQVNDLRFEESDKLVGTGSKRKERRKLRKEERKKKGKGNRENLDSLNYDIVRFGDVVKEPLKNVKAPLKVAVVPKQTPKGIQDPNKERLRLQAINAYRKKRGTTRPELEINPLLSNDPLS